MSSSPRGTGEKPHRPGTARRRPWRAALCLALAGCATPEARPPILSAAGDADARAAGDVAVVDAPAPLDAGARATADAPLAATDATADAALAATDAGLDVPSTRTCEVAPVRGFTPLGPAAAVTKVKNLLVGDAPTDEEVAVVEADPAALSGLVARWMTLPGYDAKMLAFFVSSFQQDQTTHEQFGFQFGPYRPFTGNTLEIVQNAHQSFARTVMQLIAEGAPFTSAMTTTRFMMTPALMATYAMLDNVQLDDRFNLTDLFAREHPTRVVIQSARAIPLARSIDPRDPDFMTFYHPGLATPYAPGCPVGTLEYPAPAAMMTIANFVLSHAPMPPPGAMHCLPPPLPAAARYVQPSDFTTWQMVTIRPPREAEGTTPFYDLPSMRAGRDLVLHIPRVGFFTTPAFFGRWQTNDSNLVRVVTNQTMIVALGQAVDLSSATTPLDDAAVDPAHSAPGSTCYGCHQSLDPIGQFFRNTYTLYGSAQIDLQRRAMTGQFAFAGVTAAGRTPADLGAQLAAHPRFPVAWVQRLCTYATSAPCDEADPEFVRLVGVFRDSRFSWPALVRALFASPIVSHLASTRTAATVGQAFPITRQEHLCALLSRRLELTDVCGLDVATTTASAEARVVASSWPSGQYSRGSVHAALARNPSLMLRGGLETLCASLAGRLVDADASPYQSADPDGAVRALTRRLMGLTTARAAEPAAILRGHFDSARAEGATATEALQSTFVLACLSPFVAGVGQ